MARGSAATATSRIKLGTGICLVIERDPIRLAKEVASLDWVSQGRALFGIGGGWNAEEMENHGTPFAERWKVLRERIEAMKKIWTKDEAEYHGRYVRFDKLWSYPKPVQKPYPPIVVGDRAPRVRVQDSRRRDAHQQRRHQTDADRNEHGRAAGEALAEPRQRTRRGVLGFRLHS